MTPTQAPSATRLADVKRRQRDPHPDPTQLKIDRDWLVGEVQRLTEDVADRDRALADLAVHARAAARAASGLAELAEMLVTGRPEGHL